MSSPIKRKEMDLMKLMMNDYKVETIDDAVNMFFVYFRGPSDSPYQAGEWKVKVRLPDAYPYKCPKIGFVNKIFHPNIEEESGLVCLDVIREAWSPMFELVNIFEVFLPQLLLYPNPNHPMNVNAGALLMRNPTAYEQKVKEYCELYAKPVDVAAEPDEVSSDDGSNGSDCDSSDEAMVGPVDP